MKIIISVGLPFLSGIMVPADWQEFATVTFNQVNLVAYRCWFWCGSTARLELLGQLAVIYYVA